MSTRSTIIYNGDEHWYLEMAEQDNGYYRVVLEIDVDSIADWEMDGDCLFVTLRGDSFLAKALTNTEFAKEFRGEWS